MVYMVYIPVLVTYQVNCITVVLNIYTKVHYPALKITHMYVSNCVYQDRTPSGLRLSSSDTFINTLLFE